MKKFYVTMPFAGSVTMAVDANNRDSAIEAFYENSDQVRFDTDMLDQIGATVEFEFYETLVEGNVLYPYCNKVDVDEIQ